VRFAGRIVTAGHPHQSARRALVTGFTGQDGSFLSELLLEEGYEVTGMVHGAPEGPLGCSEHLRERVQLIGGELLDPDGLAAAVADVRPDELYHLAAPSFVPASWERPAETFAAIAGATAALLQAVRDHSPHTRVFVASSAAMFGEAPTCPQREDTPCRPQSPYATAKLAGHQLAGQLRAHARLFVCCGILYNHESERRPQSFVSRKITRAVAEIKLGLADRLALGDLDAVRDWSFAGDVVHAAWLSLQQPQPGDYIFASGQPRTVAQLAQIAFAHAGLDAQEHIQVDPALQRAPESTPRVGDPTRARERLNWRPTHTFQQLVERMVDADLRSLEASQRHK
jgi:GDPmannose 4,6-dehydratase